MELQTKVEIANKDDFFLNPCDKIVCVGSCFATNIGRRLLDDKFRVTINPFGVMYNPASVYHTISNLDDYDQHLAIITLGTNHVYILKENGQIVDNCEKRPQSLFEERKLSVGECAEYLSTTIDLLLSRNKKMKIFMTVSPIRYKKYGFHESQLSKATLMLAVDSIMDKYSDKVVYFPAYEIVNDELRDYRFYAEDMIHPSEQAVDYIYERFTELFFSPSTMIFLSKWHPLRSALAHRPFNPDSEQYKTFLEETLQKQQKLAMEYEGFTID